MSIIHMDTDVVYAQGRQMIDTASTMMRAVERLRWKVNRLRGSWKSPQADYFFRSWDELHWRLSTLAEELDHLANRMMREADEWISVDQARSAHHQTYSEASRERDSSELVKYLKRLKDTREWLKALKDIGGSVGLALTLHWSLARPNSLIFRGSNTLRKFLEISEGVRVIKPSTLARTLAKVAKKTALVDGIIDGAFSAGIEYATHHDVRRALATGLVDAAFGTVVSGVVGVSVPLALGAGMAAVGAPVVVSGGVILVGSALGKFLLEARIENWWEHSAVRSQVINWTAQTVQTAQTLVNKTIVQPAKKVEHAFSGFIHNLSHVHLAVPAY